MQALSIICWLFGVLLLLGAFVTDDSDGGCAALALGVGLCFIGFVTWPSTPSTPPIVKTNAERPLAAPAPVKPKDEAEAKPAPTPPKTDPTKRDDAVKGTEWECTIPSGDACLQYTVKGLPTGGAR